MPFKSKAQLEHLKKHVPQVYISWADRFGIREKDLPDRLHPKKKSND